MNTITNRTKQETFTGTCTGTINGAAFNAGLVELSERTYPLPHGEAHVMFARDRAPAPDYTTKEITLSFTKGLEAGRYELTRDSSQVRLTYLDNSDPEKPMIYTQEVGDAHLEYDDASGVFSGRVSALVENRDDDTPRTRQITVEFEADRSAVSRNRRGARRPLAA